MFISRIILIAGCLLPIVLPAPSFYPTDPDSISDLFEAPRCRHLLSVLENGEEGARRFAPELTGEAKEEFIKRSRRRGWLRSLYERDAFAAEALMHILVNKMEIRTSANAPNEDDAAQLALLAMEKIYPTLAFPRNLAFIFPELKTFSAFRESLWGVALPVISSSHLQKLHNWVEMRRLISVYRHRFSKHLSELIKPPRNLKTADREDVITALALARKEVLTDSKNPDLERAFDTASGKEAKIPGEVLKYLFPHLGTLPGYFPEVLIGDAGYLGILRRYHLNPEHILVANLLILPDILGIPRPSSR
jgi:hypothetical protein